MRQWIGRDSFCYMGLSRREVTVMHEASARFQSALEAARAHPTGPECIHDLRVAIRRWDAVQRLLDPVSRKVWHACLGPLFRSLGDLRDLQVQRECIAHIHPASLAAFEQYVAPRKEERLNEVRLFLAGFTEPSIEPVRPEMPPSSSGERRAGRAHHARRGTKRVTQLVGRIRRSLADFAPDWPPERLHALRLYLKDLRYTLDAMDPHGSSRQERSLLKLWQDRLGEVQDLIVLRETAARGNFSTPELRDAIALRREILLRSLAGEPARSFRKKLGRLQDKGD